MELRRTSKIPATALRIVIDQPAPDSPDAGFGAGGSYEFAPAGDADGNDRAGVSEHAARVVMGDPELAKHFECHPPLPKRAAKAKTADDETAPAAPTTAAKADGAGKGGQK